MSEQNQMIFSHTTRQGGTPRGHRHIVYHRPDGSMVIGEAKGHTHPVETVQESILDPMMGVEIPVGPPQTVIGEEMGHTHDFTDFLDVDPKDPEKRGEDADECEKLRQMFKAAVEEEREPRKKAKESLDFYLGEQWKREDRRALEDKQRVALTINYISGAVDSLSGSFRQNRTDYKFWPVEDSDAAVADIMTEVVRNICEQNDFLTVETNVFEDEVICGRGAFHSYVNYDENIRGDIVIERFEWDEVYFGPHNKIDAEDAEHCHKAKWYSKDKLKSMYPDKADDIQRDYDTYEDPHDVHNRFVGRQYRESEADGTTVKLDSDFVDAKNKEYRVIETEQKVFYRIPVLASATDGVTYNAEGWEQADISAAKGLGFNVIYRPRHKMRIAKFAGNVLLEDETIDEKDFSITPVYAKKRKNIWLGKVEDAKDPQRELNKTRSHGVDIINKSVANGWIYGNGTFANNQQRDLFIQKSTTPGFVLEVQDVKNPPVKIETNSVPSSIVQMQETAREEVNRVLNVRPELLDSKYASNLALIQGQKIAYLGSEYLYDNMAQSKKRLGKRVVRLIQQVYTPERIIRILGTMAARDRVNVAGQQVDPRNQQQMEMYFQTIKNALDNEDLTRLDLVVGESSHSPNKQMADFVAAVEIARVTGGQAIPPDMLLELSTLSKDKKDKAMQFLQQQRQAAQQAQQQKQQMEIQKSMPDEVKLATAMRGGQGQMQRGGGMNQQMQR